METRGSRIKQRRVELGITQPTVAKFMGIESRGAVSQWESDLSRPKNMERLAEILKTNTTWLETGKGEKEARTATVSSSGDVVFPAIDLVSKKIPVISWVQAGAWNDIGCDDPAMTCTEWMETSSSVSEHAFALIVRGDSMTNPNNPRSIQDGAKVVVEPIFDPEQLNRKIVVAMLEGSSEATIKEFIQDGPVKFLKPLNPAYPSMQVNGNCRIVGVVKQIVVDL